MLLCGVALIPRNLGRPRKRDFAKSSTCMEAFLISLSRDLKRSREEIKE